MDSVIAHLRDVDYWASCGLSPADVCINIMNMNTSLKDRCGLLFSKGGEMWFMKTGSPAQSLVELDPKSDEHRIGCAFDLCDTEKK